MDGGGCPAKRDRPPPPPSIIPPHSPSLTPPPQSLPPGRIAARNVGNEGPARTDLRYNYVLRDERCRKWGGERKMLCVHVSICFGGLDGQTHSTYSTWEFVFAFDGIELCTTNTNQPTTWRRRHRPRPPRPRPSSSPRRPRPPQPQPSPSPR